MITVINKKKYAQTYNLDCAIPLVGAKAERVVIEKKVKKDKKFVTERIEKKFSKKATERVLTLQGGEKRVNLPNAVIHSVEIQNALNKKEIAIKEQKPAKSLSGEEKAKLAKAKIESDKEIEAEAKKKKALEEKNKKQSQIAASSDNQ